MSARQIKKLRAQEELARKATLVKATTGSHGSGSDSDDSLDEIQARPARPGNAFAAFAALADGDNENDENDENEDEEEAEAGRKANGEEQLDAAPAPIPKATAAKKKKKKNKKKAKKGDKEDGVFVAVGKGADKAAKTAGGKGKQDMDEIDRALEALRLQNNKSDSAGAESGQPPAPKQQQQQQQHRIKINLQNLRVLNELRDVFGSTVLAMVQDEELDRAAGNPDDERLIRVDLETFLRAPVPGSTQNRLLPESAGIVFKRNPFIQWKDTWPRATSRGLSMKQIGGPDAHGIVEYAFVHGKEYIGLEEQFQTMTLVMHTDANTIFHFLYDSPFHIASLIVVSILARTHDQNPTLSADLLERALFSFGRATLSSFRAALTDPAGCRARMDFRRPENRQFVLAGYHYICSLIGRGTFRTALEWLKVFLSLMPNDEQGLLLFAQTVAIQAYEAKWFVDYMSTYASAASAETAEAPRTDNVWPMLEYIRQSVVPAKLQLKDKAGARTALLDGVARVPWLYGALFQALDKDVPRAVWAVLPRDDAEKLYTELYIDVAKELWSPGVMAFVAAELETISKPDIASIPATAPATLTIARFVYLRNKPALMGLVVPSSLLHSLPNADFDPLPPKRGDNIFSYPSQQRPWTIFEDSQFERQRAALEDQLAAAAAALGARPEVNNPRGWLNFFRGLGFGGRGPEDPEPAFDVMEASDDDDDDYEGDSNDDEDVIHDAVPAAADEASDDDDNNDDDDGQEEHRMPGQWAE